MIQAFLRSRAINSRSSDMSRLIRTPKSASDWTDNELDAYRVVIKEQTISSFFGTGELPEPNCPQDFLHNRTATENIDRATDSLLWYMEETAMQPRLGEAPVDQFARALFDATSFTSRRVHSSIRRPLQLLIGGEQRSAQTDVCLVYDRTVLLLVQEDKAEDRPAGYGEAQLIAEAVAARQCNVRNGVLSREATEIIPAILMIGTYPIFYRIPVSAELSLSIASLSYPAIETVVTKCLPEVPRPESKYVEGMHPLDNRAAILRYLEAFRRHVFIPCSEEMLGTRLIL
jgi:hypothetical protein